MGLDCSHNVWHGAYSQFSQWRRHVAAAAGMPPLELMEGFYRPFADQGLSLQIKWTGLKSSPLHELLDHSDCDGEIEHHRCGIIADELEKIIDLMPDVWKKETFQFIEGLRAANLAGENLEFR